MNLSGRSVVVRWCGFFLLIVLFSVGGCSDKSVVVTGPGPIPCEQTPALRTGRATYYTWADGGGNCGFDPTPNDLMVAAMNHTDYGGALACGSCVRIIGPRGEITVRIVDRCPECPQGDIDLSPLAFSRIAEIAAGIVPIQWHLVPCPTPAPILYHFKNGSNQWWTAVQIRNHRNPVLAVEYLTSQGSYRRINRTEYNYFVEPNGMGPGPYTFRVTDIYGHTLVDSNVVHTANASVQGRAQFPPCPG